MPIAAAAAAAVVVVVVVEVAVVAVAFVGDARDRRGTAEGPSVRLDAEGKSELVGLGADADAVSTDVL